MIVLFQLLFRISLAAQDSLAMAQWSRLLNLSSWWTVGWMEMGFLQADGARCLNMSWSVVQNSKISLHNEIRCLEDLF